MASRASLKLLRLARANDGPAQLELGRLYLSGGDGIAPNRDAALMWLTRAASRGISEASHVIARHISPDMISDGQALLCHYEAAAQAGDASGALYAGMVWQALAGELARERSRHFFGLAAEAGSAQAQVALARMLDESGGSPDAAVDRLLVKAADAGSDEAVLALAERAWKKRDPQGLEAVRAAAQGGSAAWCYRLGLMLRLSAADESSVLESGTWLAKATEGGHAEAQYEYGMMLAGLAPTAMRRNYKRAARLLESALDDGVAAAGVALAQLHDNPRFEGRDAGLAQQSLTRSARLGHCDAQCELGLLLQKGLRRAESRNAGTLLECARWLHEAVAAGHPEAGAALARVVDFAPTHDANTLAYQALCVMAVAMQQPAIAMRLRLMAAFGLSKAEMLLIDPVAADQGFCVAIGNEAGKRCRLVRVEGTEQRALLEESKRALDDDADVDAATPYPARYRKLMNLAKRYDIDLGRFLG